MISLGVAGRISLLSALSAALAGCGSGGVLPALSSLPSSSSTTAPKAVSNGSQLGYLWSSTGHALIPVLGVPGSSQMGAAVTGAGVYAGGAASSRSGIALLIEPDGSLDSMLLPSGAPQRIAGASVAAGSQIVFSPNGTDAVVFASGSTAVTLVTGLGSAPQAQTLTAVASVAGAAVSDGGQVAVAAGSGPVTVALLTGSKGVVASISGFGGLGFLPGSDDLLIADSGSAAVMVVRHSSTAPSTQSFSSALIHAAVAVAGSQDGQWAVVANGGDQSVVRLDLSGASAPLRIGCTCQPAMLAPFDGNAVFRLTAPSSGPTWMVDAGAATPSTYFIPAVKP